MNRNDAGLRQCSRYAFAPNFFHFCGPEKQSDLLGYIHEGASDSGLTELLSRFDTLYKYLVLIASENKIHDPFDIRVVEAYWLGNALTLNVKQTALVRHVSDDLAVSKKMSAKKFAHIADSLMSHGLPTHTDHVLSIFIRTGHHSIVHTLTTMDQCRIGWGRVISDDSTTHDQTHRYMIKTQPLEYVNEKLRLGRAVVKSVKSIGVSPQVGDWVSVHWGYVCAVLSDSQLKHLVLFTHRAIASAQVTL